MPCYIKRFGQGHSTSEKKQKQTVQDTWINLTSFFHSATRLIFIAAQMLNDHEFLCRRLVLAVFAEVSTWITSRRQHPFPSGFHGSFFFTHQAKFITLLFKQVRSIIILQSILARLLKILTNYLFTFPVFLEVCDGRTSRRASSFVDDYLNPHHKELTLTVTRHHNIVENIQVNNVCIIYCLILQ